MKTLSNVPYNAMRKTIFLFLLVSVPFQYLCSAGKTPSIATADMTKSSPVATMPQLLWEKKFDKPITSSAISKDGEKIAIATEDGYLRMYNRRGEQLWAYRYEGELPKETLKIKSDKWPTKIGDIVFSDSGKYIVCDLNLLVLDERWGKGELAVSFYKKLCLNSEGKLLWQTDKGTCHAIGGDEYVLIRSIQSGDEINPDETESIDYYLYNMKGQLLHTGKSMAEYAVMGFSEDAKYMFMDNKIIETGTNKVFWEFEGKYWTFWGIYKNFAVISWVNETRVYDIISKKKILEDVNYLSDYSFVNNHFIALGGGGVKIWDLKTGEIASEWQYRVKEVGNHKALYLARNEKHLLISGEKGMILYNIRGKKLWRIASHYKNNGFHPRYISYSPDGNIESVLFDYDRSIKLYKAF